MKNDYEIFLSSIKRCNGNVVYIFKDHNKNNKHFIDFLNNDLKHNYNIIENVNYDKIDFYINTVKIKTILWVDTSNVTKNEVRKIANFNDNLIIILYSYYFKNSTGMFYYHPLLYISSFVFQLVDNNVKIIKNRYSDIYPVISLDNIVSKIRKAKLLKIK